LWGIVHGIETLTPVFRLAKLRRKGLSTWAGKGLNGEIGGKSFCELFRIGAQSPPFWGTVCTVWNILPPPLS
jgi:hypothetical protein